MGPPLTSAKFGGDRHRGRGETMVLVYHVISGDHVTKGSSNMGGSLSSLVSSLPNIVVISTVIVEI